MDVTITCQCPGEHGEDVVTFFDRLDFRRATIIGKALSFIENRDPDTRPAEVLATLSEYYLLYGIEKWSLVGPDRKRLEVNPAAIRSQLFDHPDVGLLVEAADEQYQEQVLLPLVNRAARSSPTSQTASSTSVTPRSRRATRKPSSPSSISTIPMDATVTTSQQQDGGFNYSPNSESAAS